MDKKDIQDIEAQKDQALENDIQNELDTADEVNEKMLGIDEEKLAEELDELDMPDDTEDVTEAADIPEIDDVTEPVESSEDASLQDEPQSARQLEPQNEEMTELVAEKDDRKYTDDEIEEMDSRRMAHVIMNDESRTDQKLLSELFGEDEYSMKQKRKEQKKAEKLARRKATGDTKGVRFIGILSILMALAGVALVLVTIYFLMVAPTYNKTDYLSHSVSFEDSATLSDADYTQVKEDYYVPEATGSDAQLASDTDAMQGGEANE